MVYGLGARSGWRQREGKHQRAAVSVAANLAKGAGRWGIEEYRHFLSITRGSLAELRTLLKLSRRFGYLDVDRFGALIPDMDSVDKMPFVLHRNLGGRRE